MGFDIARFAEEFEITISWMLANRCTQNIKDDLQHFQSNKNKLTLNPDSLDALWLIIELITTNGFRLNKPITFDDDMNSFITKHGADFRTPEARQELARLVGSRREKCKRPPRFSFNNRTIHEVPL